MSDEHYQVSREVLLEILRSARQIMHALPVIERALADGDARARAAGEVIGPPRAERLPVRVTE